VTTDSAPLAPDADLVRVLRELYNCLLRARPFLEAAVEHYDALLLAVPREVAAESLDRLDDELADAGELLARVTS
jgi:hypothetical protein